MEKRELFAEALRACGGDKEELARRLGMRLSSARQFARWSKGQGINFARTLQLLEVAGLLRQPGERDELLALIQTIREQDAFRDESVADQVALQKRLRALEDHLQADDAL